MPNQGGGWVFDDDAADRIAGAVREVEARFGQRLGSPDRPVSSADPILVRCTSATPDGDGNFPAIATWPDGAGGWTDAESAIVLKMADGSTPTSGVRYLARPAAPQSGNVVYVAETAGGGAGIAVAEADGTPSYASVTSITLDQAQGLVLTQPGGAGTALVSIADASGSQPGVVNTTTQSFNGTKTFTRVQVHNGGGATSVLADDTLILSTGGAETVTISDTGSGTLFYARIKSIQSDVSWGQIDLGGHAAYFRHFDSVGAETTGYGVYSPGFGIITLPAGVETFTDGGSATTGGLTFLNGLYISGSFTGGTVSSITAGTGMSGGTITTTGTIALADAVPRWVQFTVPAAALAVGATGLSTNTITLSTLPARLVIHEAFFYSATPVTGGSISAYAVSVSRDADAFAATLNLFGIVGPVQAYDTGGGGPPFGPSATLVTTSLTVTATSTGDTLDHAATGSFDIMLLISTLP